VKLIEHTLKLETAAGKVGGAPISVTGQADLRGNDWLKGVLPPFEFALRGTNVPLSRQPESIIRSDLDLVFSKTNGSPPLVSGAARLRDSFFMSDLKDLVPRGAAAAPRRRPPYFSVEDPALANWRLSVVATGERFLKVRTTLFNGLASANLKVHGTLQDPLALGELKIDSGVVRFPFASLEVRRGFVALTTEDPYRPKLLVSAASKQFGYEIRLEMSGQADDPVLQFTSTPPLSSEQIVLMITAGQLPRGEFTFTPQQKAQTVGIFLGRDLLAKMGFSDDTEQRLTIHSGEEISEQGRPTYNIEYKLSPGWSLVGEYDRFNAFNTGLKWRIYSK